MAPPTLRHARRDVPCENHWCPEVDVEGSIDLRGGEVVERPGGRQRCVADDDVHVAEVGEELVDLRRFGEVTHSSLGVVQFGHDCLEHVSASPCEDQARPALIERASQSSAQPAARPSQENAEPAIGTRVRPTCP